MASAQKKTVAGIKPDLSIKKNLTDDQLLDLVQKQTFRYFWDFGHPVSGMARERSNRSFDYGDEVVTTGGTGFGVMAMIVASERKFITREQAAERTKKNSRLFMEGRYVSWCFPSLVKWRNRKSNPL